MSILNRVSISTKLYAGFGIVLVVLLVISVVTGLDLENADSSFARYRAIALQSNEAGRVQANLLAARVAVKDFVARPSQQATATVKERIAATRAYDEELLKVAVSDETAAVAKEVRSAIDTYVGAFDAVVKLQGQRDDLVLNTLDKIGPDLERSVTEMAGTILADLEPTSAKLAVAVQRTMLLAHLYANKFLVTNGKADFDRALTESAAMTENGRALRDKTTDTAVLRRLDDVEDMHKRYDETLNQIHVAIAERNRLVSDTLHATGETIATRIEGLKLALKKEQDVLGPAARAEMTEAVRIDVAMSIAAVLIGIAAAWIISAGISRPVRAITSAMESLAGGDTEISIPGRDHKDEIGAMAGAVQVFKENAIGRIRLEREAEEAKARAQREKVEAMNVLADEFQSSVGGIVESVSAAASEMEASAENMTTTAKQTSRQAAAVAAASEQASANVQTVSAAADELSASIAEISRQVAQSVEIARTAVTEANRTNDTVKSLADSAQRIGEVVDLISDIAEQTNLLALNATIEAARAGDAGKGFAVVANEVKSLASQTARATEEIGAQITDIQSATGEAVGAIAGIGNVIEQLNDIAAAIAAAVEEQGAATQEIARNVEEAARGTQDVSTNIGGVNVAADETGAGASQVLSAAGELSHQASTLRTKVEDFVASVRST